MKERPVKAFQPAQVIYRNRLVGYCDALAFRWNYEKPINFLGLPRRCHPVLELHTFTLLDNNFLNNLTKRTQKRKLKLTIRVEVRDYIYRCKIKHIGTIKATADKTVIDMLEFYKCV